MANRNVTFSFAPDPNTVGLLDHFALRIVDSTGAQVYAVGSIPKTATSYTANAPVGTGYTATLTAYNASNQPDANPPTQAFDVPAPPPTIPGDPTLQPPTFA